jgi:hypothetical protein
MHTLNSTGSLLEPTLPPVQVLDHFWHVGAVLLVPRSAALSKEAHAPPHHRVPKSTGSLRQQLPQEKAEGIDVRSPAEDVGPHRYGINKSPVTWQAEQPSE